MTERWHLYLDGTQVLARRRSGLLGRRIEALGRWQWDASDPASLAFPASLRPPAGTRLHLHAGSALARFAVMHLPSALRDGAEQRAAAEAHLHQQLGLDRAEWACTLDADGASGKAVVCALRRSVTGRLRALADAHGLRLVSLTPFVTGVWNAFQRKEAAQRALLLVEDDAFTLLSGRGAAIDAISAFGHRREPELIEREIRRLALSVADGAAPALRLAVGDHLLGMAQAHQERRLMRADYLGAGLYPDFRDLVFDSGTALPCAP